MKKLGDLANYIPQIVILIFLLINFDLTIGTIYYAIGFFDVFLYFVATAGGYAKPVVIDKPETSKYVDLVTAGLFYFGFTILAGFVTIKMSSTQSLSSLIVSTFSATPILYGSAYMKVIVWGVMIPILETSFFFKILPVWGLRIFGYSYPKSPFEKKSIFISVLFGAIFALFHLLAKGITNNVALVITWLFGVLSMMMIIYYQEAVQAIFLHIITNSKATMDSLSIVYSQPSGITMLVIVAMLSWFLLFLEVPFINRVRT